MPHNASADWPATEGGGKKKFKRLAATVKLVVYRYEAKRRNILAQKGEWVDELSDKPRRASDKKKKKTTRLLCSV
jgi:hypothetical protein